MFFRRVLVEIKSTYTNSAFTARSCGARSAADGQPITIPPKDLETLLVLSSGRGTSSKKEELLEKVGRGFFRRGRQSGAPHLQPASVLGD